MLITWHTQFSFCRTADDLEDEQLKVQIDHAVALLEVLRAGGKPKEPAYYMWHKHLEAFMVMGMLMVQEISLTRRYDGKDFWKFARAADSLKSKRGFHYWPPPWFRDADLCRSHRSVLMAAVPASYDLGIWPGTPAKMPLLWPVVGDDGALAELRVAKADLPRLKSGELSIPKAMKERIVNA